MIARGPKPVPAIIRQEQVTKDLLLASDSRLVSELVLLDLSAAFDTIDHSILFQRPQHVIKIKGTALGWFKS